MLGSLYPLASDPRLGTCRAAVAFEMPFSTASTHQPACDMLRPFHAPAATPSSPDDEPAGAAPIAAADAGDDDVGLQQLLSHLDGAAQAEPAPQPGPAAVSESISIEMEALQVRRWAGP